MRRLYELETAKTRRVYPTRMVSHTIRQHATFGAEAFYNSGNILEVFDDHEEHVGRIDEASELSNYFNHLYPRYAGELRKIAESRTGRQRIHSQRPGRTAACCRGPNTGS